MFLLRKNYYNNRGVYENSTNFVNAMVPFEENRHWTVLVQCHFCVPLTREADIQFIVTDRLSMRFWLGQKIFKNKQTIKVGKWDSDREGPSE